LGRPGGGVGALIMAGSRISRYGGVDTLRGLAVLWMMSFHFSFDLNWFGFIHTNFYTSPWWLDQRIAIVSLFVFTVGLTQSFTDASGRPARHFWKRWAQIVGASLLVTAGSYAAFPHSFIYFGILQGIAAMLLLHRLVFRHFGAWVLLLAPIAIAAPQLWGPRLFQSAVVELDRADHAKTHHRRLRATAAVDRCAVDRRRRGLAAGAGAIPALAPSARNSSAVFPRALALDHLPAASTRFRRPGLAGCTSAGVIRGRTCRRLHRLSAALRRQRSLVFHSAGEG
jgi:Predicted membrane protein